MTAEAKLWVDPYEVLTPEKRKAIQVFNARTVGQVYENNGGSLTDDVNLGMFLYGVNGPFSARLHITLTKLSLIIAVAQVLTDNSTYILSANTVVFVHRELKEDPNVLIVVPRIKTLPGFEGLGFGTGITNLTDVIIPCAIALNQFRTHYPLIISEVVDDALSFNPKVSRSRDGVGWTTALMSSLGYQPAANFPDLIRQDIIRPGALVKCW